VFCGIFVVFAIICDRTCRALWLACYAVISSEEDNRMMDDSFSFSIEYFIKFFVCLFGCLGVYSSETIHHAVDMCIDSDIWHIVED